MRRRISALATLQKTQGGPVRPVRNWGGVTPAPYRAYSRTVVLTCKMWETYIHFRCNRMCTARLHLAFGKALGASRKRALPRRDWAK